MVALDQYCRFNIKQLFFHKTKIASDNIDYPKIKKGLYTVGFLAYLFLFGQLVVWYQLMSQDYYATSNVANAYCYLLTTLHGLHLIGGLIFGLAQYLYYLKEIINYQICNTGLSFVQFTGIFY
jgi:heme/copper-type cytochrome/quinol oxidase subunit 3